MEEDNQSFEQYQDIAKQIAGRTGNATDEVEKAKIEKAEQRHKKYKRAKTFALIYLIANLSSFSQVGMQKLIGLSQEQAAFYNYYSYGREFSPVGILYGLGAQTGHKLFYGNGNFREIAQSQLENSVQNSTQ